MQNLLNEAQGASGQFKAIPQRQKSKVLNIDGDFLCYQIAADTRDEIDGIRPMRSLEYKYGQVEDIAVQMMEEAGAGSYVLHVTPSGSNKGGRDDQAVQKEYQANRKAGAREKPEHLDIIRAYMASGEGLRFGRGVAHLNQEADDGLAQANYNDIENSYLASKDKDLRMVPGWHYDSATRELHFVDPADFGTLWLDKSGSTTRLKGWGPAFFFAQCLMGDTVDNIAGLPKVSGYTLNPPPRDFSLDACSDAEAKRYKAAWGKLKPCGPVMAYDLLKEVSNKVDATLVVGGAFSALARHGGYEFTHWRTGESVPWHIALLGDMKLLWMRRNENPDDVVNWLGEQ